MKGEEASTPQAEALGKERTGETQRYRVAETSRGKGHCGSVATDGRARASRRVMGRILAGVLTARGSQREVGQRVCGDKMCILERSFWLPYGNRLEEAEHMWDNQCRAQGDGRVVMMVVTAGS